MYQQSMNPITRASLSNRSSHSLAIIGHLAIDTIIHPGFRLDNSPGGSPAAVATAAAQLGIDCLIQSRVGVDFPLEWLSVLENLGIDVSQVEVEEKKESLHVTMRYDDEGRIASIQCNDRIRDDVKLRAMPRTEALHICPLKPDNQGELARKLSNRGDLLSVGFSDYFIKDYMKKEFFDSFPWKDLDCAFFNVSEAAAMTGADNPEDMARAFCDAGVDIAAVNLGKEGAVVCSNSKIYKAGARDVTVVDPTGCNESFTGGFLGEYLKSKDIKRAAGMGIYLASLTAQKKGSWAALMSDVGVRFK